MMPKAPNQLIGNVAVIYLLLVVLIMMLRVVQVALQV